MSEWIKQHRRVNNMRVDTPVVTASKIGFSLSHGCHFTPDFVDIYTEPQGSGMGVKIAFVPSETGEFRVHKPSNKAIKTDQRSIYCKGIIDELKCLYDKYEAHTEVIHGREAAVITVKVESTLGKL